jgi:hypothetical protein
MITEYIVRFHSVKAWADFKLKYKAGRFLSIEHLKGKLNQKQHESLFLVAPQLEGAILILKDNFKGRVSWELVQKDKSLYSFFVDEYLSWYETKFNLKPKFSGVEGKSLKSIISFLQGVCSTDEEAKDIWLAILSNWDIQSEFYKNQTELRQINSNLNIILKTFKNGKQSEQKRRKADDDANDFREKV